MPASFAPAPSRPVQTLPSPDALGAARAVRRLEHDIVRCRVAIILLSIKEPEAASAVLRHG